MLTKGTSNLNIHFEVVGLLSTVKQFIKRNFFGKRSKMKVGLLTFGPVGEQVYIVWDFGG